MIRTILSAAAMTAVVLTGPASAADLSAAAEQEIVQAARRGEPLGARDLIAKHAAGDAQALRDGWAAALAGADTGQPKAVRTLARLSEEATHDAVGISARDPAAAAAIGKAVTRHTGPWSGEMTASAAKVATDLSRLAKAAIRTDSNAAAELSLNAVQMAGRAKADHKQAAEVAANAQAVADSLRTTNPQVAMQITSQLRSSKLHR